MVEWFGRSRPGTGRLHWLLAALLFQFITFACQAAADDESIVVSIDESTIINLPDSTRTIVLGDPLIADITILRNSGSNLIVIVIGKGYGVTNLVAFDSKGVELTKKMVMVTGPTDNSIAVVYRGADRETYSCAPKCLRRATLGDSPEAFDKALAQIKTRDTQAKTAGAPTSGQ
jgi:hypothetical protein